MSRLLRTALMAAMLSPTAAPAQVLGSDAEACAAGGPALLVEIAGLKDRNGRVKVELYPAAEDDFLKDDRDLIAAGKTFRRVWATMPASGAVRVCIRVPHAGRYAVFVTHDRDGKNKFNFFADGAGLPSAQKMGMSRPKLAQGLVTAGPGVTAVPIRMQYLRSVFSGFGPSRD